MSVCIKKISVFSIWFFGIFSLFPNEKRGVLFIVLILASIFSLIKGKKIKFHKLVLINSILFLIYLLALSYSSDILVAAKRFETASSIMIAPVVFSFFYYNQKVVFSEKNKLLFFKVLHWSNIAFMFVIITFYLKIRYVDQQVEYGYFLSHLERRLPFLNDHPIYISIIFSISVIFSTCYILTRKQSVKFNYIYGVSAFLMFLLILFLSRKGVILALIISLTLIFVFYKKNNLKIIILASIAFFFLVTSLLFFIPQTNKRISEMFDKATYVNKNETNSTSNRLQIYKCAIDLIKEKPIFGYGIEDDRKALYQCFKERLYYLYEFRFNTHNQYLSIVMKVGLFGLLAFLFFLGYNLKMATITNDWLFVGIIVFFSIIMFFENILERQNGVMLFSFLINYLAFKNSLLLDRKNKI
ncbi:O-antigen ligase family protein [uncultured Olleya sp.]|uniref:O-antigen ligase family protein n=1 Tax=uncultured Olleya sp. TaxID=757243 RepID=UPI0025941371|nr:O-antigen ligase family protein [uncultured Olleya sp.]